MKMKRCLLLTMLLLSLKGISQSEPSFIRTYGMPDGFHYGLRLSVLPDSTYILLGNKNGFHGTNNIYVLHINWQGMIIKDQVFGGQSLWNATDMKTLDDSIFWICGYTLNTITHDYDALLMKINKNLELLDWIIFGSNDWDFARALAVDNTQNVYVISSTYTNSIHQSIHITQFDENLNLKNEKYFHLNNTHIIPYAALMLYDSFLLICGTLIPDTGFHQGFILKFDQQLNLMDTLLLTDHQGNIQISDIDASNSKIFITGKWSSVFQQENKFLYGIYDLNFQQLHFETSLSTNDWCNCIKYSPDISLTVFGGVSYVYGAGGGDFLFFIFDDQWFITSATIGKNLYEEVFDCDFALDSSVVLIGTTRSYGQNHSSIMFAKTCKTFHCPQDHLHQTFIHSFDAAQCEPIIFPNPAHNDLYIQTCDNQSIPFTLKIYTPQGQLIENISFHSAKPNRTYHVCLRTIPSGTYIISLTDTKCNYVTRLIKL